MYYKAIKDNMIVDVWDESIVYVRRMGDMILRCRDIDAPFGVLASDSSVIFALDNSAGYDHIELRAFDDPEEYARLREIIDAGRFEPEPEPTPEPEPEYPMTIAEMREKIAALTALVMNESGPFAARQTYQTGEIIANGARVYIARQVIVQGETVAPGVNCDETTIADVLNTLQAQQ